MKSERLKQIEEIYHAVLQISPEKRESFLAKHCGSDEDLRREVESLLIFEKSGENFLDAPPESLVAEMLGEQESPDNLIGSEISHYRIKNFLGKGGMGAVYLAHDTRLNRQVALKILPPDFIDDKGRMARFVKEAKTASALNHPNIITIYEIGEIGETHFIAAEYIEGETLHSHQKKHPKNLPSVLEIAIQIASALDAAHCAGIIHRDIKPENIMVRPDGFVKVLDFGIAKLTADLGILDADSGADFRQMENLQSEETSPGIIIGTPNYMSPEQARGKTVDARSDIFSFGIVLYEMLSGKKAFTGENAFEVIGKILDNELPSIKKISVDFPSEIERIVNKTLRKNLEERYQTSKDLLVDLKAAKQNLEFQDQLGRTSSPNWENPQTHLTNMPTEAGLQPTQSSAEFISQTIIKHKYRAFFIILFILSTVVGLGYLSFFKRTASGAKQINSIAVMPFVNDSGNENIEYLSDGMTETLIRSLSTIPNLSIKARSTVFTYKGKEKSPQTIGAELNVDAVLLGRLVQRGRDLKLNLELVDTATQDILWTEIYERKINDLVSLQSEIARDVSDKLRLKLTTAEQNRVAKTFTTNSEAQQLYLRGRFYWNKRNVKDFEKAIEYFKQAIEKDPYHAQAYAGLADTYALMPLYGNFRPTEYMPKAKDSVLKALEIDGNLATSHASLGRILNSYDFDWAGAEREYKIAINLNPNYATAHQWYAEHLAFKGRTDEALEEIAKALEIDPYSVTINRMKGNILGFTKRYDEAIVQLKKTEELFPENALVKFNLGDAFAAQGKYSEAIEQYLAALRLDAENPETIQKLKDAYETGGWNGFWQKYLENQLELRKTLLEKDQTAYIDNEGIAYAYAAVKDKAKTLEYLNKAFAERDPDLVTIKTSEVYGFLADDPQFRELIKNIGLPE